MNPGKETDQKREGESIRALILDRDGTLIKHVPYMSDPAHVDLLPSVVDGLQLANANHIRLFLHTNQSGVGRGMYQLPSVHECNRRMIELLEMGDDLFDDICIAPEAPDQPSEYRKPSPRFANEIMAKYELQKNEVCYIGDRGSDLQTAANAGTLGVGVSTGLDDLHAELSVLGLREQYPVFSSFDQAIHHLLKQENAQRT